MSLPNPIPPNRQARSEHSMRHQAVQHTDAENAQGRAANQSSSAPISSDMGCSGLDISGIDIASSAYRDSAFVSVTGRKRSYPQQAQEYYQALGSAMTMEANRMGELETNVPAPAVTTLAPAVSTLAPAVSTLAPSISTLAPAMATLAPAATTLAPAGALEPLNIFPDCDIRSSSMLSPMQPLSPDSIRRWSGESPPNTPSGKFVGGASPRPSQRWNVPHAGAAPPHLGWSLDELAAECEAVANVSEAASKAPRLEEASYTITESISERGPPRMPVRTAAFSTSCPDLRPQQGRIGVPAVRTRACKQRVSWSRKEDELVRSMIMQQGNKWARIAGLLPGRTHAAVRNRWSRLQEGGLDAEDYAEEQGMGSDSSTASNSDDRLKWRVEEDQHILEGVRLMGRKWRKIAEGLPGRNEQAIRNRYYRLSTHTPTASTSQGCWTLEEDELIMNSVLDVGKKWTTIAQRLPHRSEDAIRNRYTRLKRAEASVQAP